jgi:cation:H+ antiporter
MIAASLVVWFFALDGRFSLIESVALLAGLVAFVVFTVREGGTEFPVDAPGGAPRLGRDIGCVAVGLVLLVLGARLFVAAAVATAMALGVSETVIGLTIVAAGTSLPEVAASVVATLRGERDIAVGNVVGSNIFNLLGILGTTGIVAGGRLPVAPSIEHFDLPVMVATACACLPLFASGHRIARWEGALFFFYYVAYTGYLVLAAKRHDALTAASAVMLEFVVPLTVVTLVVVGVRARAEGARLEPSGGRH